MSTRKKTATPDMPFQRTRRRSLVAERSLGSPLNVPPVRQFEKKRKNVTLS